MGTYVKVDVDLMNKLVTSFDKTQSNLTNDGYSLSGYLDQAWEDPSHAKPVNTSGTWAGGEVPSLRRRAALAVTAAAAEPGPLKPGMTVQIDEDQISKLTPAQSKALADSTVAELKNELKGNGVVGAKLDAKTVSTIEANMNDPYFAAQFAKDYPPDQLTALLNQMQNQRTGAAHYGGGQLSAPIAALQTRLLKDVGITIATATRQTGALAPPADYAQQWLDAIGAGDATTIQAGAPATAAELMKYGQWGTSFLQSYNQGIIGFENSDKGRQLVGQSVNGYNWWGRLSISTADASVPLTVQLPDGSRANWDPLSGGMTALGNNPVAAQTVLNSPAVLKYLTDRSWPTDDGQGLGNAVDAATEVFRNTGTSGKTSATIASNLINDIDGDKVNDGLKGMKGSLGRLFASYIADVDRVSAQNGSDATVPGATNLPDTGMPPGQPWGANFDLDRLKDVLGATETDDGAFKTVSAAGLAYETSRLNYALQHGGSTSSDTYTNAVEHDAAVMGLLMSTGGVANVAAGKEKDERTAEWLSLAQGAADMIPLPESKLLELAVSQGEDRLVDSLQTDYEGAAIDKADSTATAMENTLRLQTVTALYRNGAIAVGGPQDPVASYPGGKDFASYNIVNGKQVIVLADPKDLSPTAQQEYQNWLNSAGSPYTKLEPTLLAVYNNEFKKYWGQ